jgi:3-hydroxybutyryl-CoA dehydrogenase
MKIVVLATEEHWIFLKDLNTEIIWQRANSIEAFLAEKSADAYFDLLSTEVVNYSTLKAPLFTNAVTKTLKELDATKNTIRINAWNGFLENNLWEIAGIVTTEVENVLKKLNKKFIVVPDEPGFVSARIIAMIINEAYFAKGENVSTEHEIDIAMRLGTNYPYGPFEWGKKIGLKNIYSLLSALSTKEERYKPAPALKNEIENTL